MSKYSVKAHIVHNQEIIQNVNYQRIVRFRLDAKDLVEAREMAHEELKERGFSNYILFVNSVTDTA